MKYNGLKGMIGAGLALAGLPLLFLALLPTSYFIVPPATSGQVAITGNATLSGQASTGDIVFQTGFESGDPEWDYVWTPASVTINTDPTYVHSGARSLQIHYYICGDSENPDCGAAHQDQNHWVSKIISPGLAHFFIRGYLYFKTPEADATPGVIIQRKLIRFSDSPSAGAVNAPGATYGFYLVGYNAVQGQYIDAVSLSLAMGATVVSACSPGTNVYIWDVAQFDYDTWYSLELEVQLNTPGNSDGIGRIWVNGTKVLDRADLNYRDSCTTPVTGFFLGNQADRTNYDVVDEYRYWDDVKISRAYIGP
jgi:hypothetical protein